MPNIFGIILVFLLLGSAAVAVIQLFKRDYSSLGEIIGRIIIGILVLYLIFK